MTLTVEQAKTALQDHTPSCGGYGSELKLEQHPKGVVVTLLADWAPRFSAPKALLLTLEDETSGPTRAVSFRFPDGWDDWDEERTDTAKGLLDWLGEQASEGG